MCHTHTYIRLRLTLLFALLVGLSFPALPVGAQSFPIGQQLYLPLVDSQGDSENRSPTTSVVPGQYIVVLHETGASRAVEGQAVSAADLASTITAKYGGVIHTIYQHALNGFAASLPQAAVDELEQHPAVAFVEQDQIMQAVGTQSPVPSWGLDRIDQQNLPLNNSYTYAQSGVGVHAYIIDTGMRVTHNEFADRTASGYSAINDGNGTNDCHGHGTHVGGTVGGSAYGVAKSVTLHPVRVLDCAGSGYTSWVIAGIDWVTANHVKPAVANMSLGGGASTSLDNAVRNSIIAGVTYAVAAGNQNRDACTSSPARVAQALTVAASTAADARASFSNFGACVNIFAPGAGITSAVNNSNSASATWSGTSMATPHVVGAAALYLEANPQASPTQVMDALVENATAGLLSGIGSGSPNRLLYTAFATAPPLPGTLQGNVNDRLTNVPISGATVTIVDGPSTTTDGNGFYSFSNLAPGAYSVTASKAGYDSLTANGVQVTAGNVAIRNFALQPVPVGSSPIVYVSMNAHGTVGAMRYADEDILAYDTATGSWTRYFDGSDVGLAGSSARNVDAFHRMTDGSILLSFASGITLPTLGIIDDSDIVRFTPTSLGTTTTGSYALYFDGSDVGLATNNEDVDAITLLADGRLILSTLGGFSVPGVRGTDEDLLAFNPTSLGANTSGSWSIYFDGSDVGLHNSGSEDTNGVSIDSTSGDIYLTTLGNFSVAGASGIAGDVLVCSPASLGNVTSCSFSLFWEGLQHGLGTAAVDGLSIGLDGTLSAASVPIIQGENDPDAQDDDVQADWADAEDEEVEDEDEFDSDEGDVEEGIVDEVAGNE